MHKYRINIRGLLIRIFIFFLVLTGLNVVIFTIMAFVNQSNLMVDVAITSSHNKGILISQKISGALNLNEKITNDTWGLISKSLIDEVNISQVVLDKIQTELKEKKSITESDLEKIKDVLKMSDLKVMRYKVFDQQANVIISDGYPEAEKLIATELEQNRIVKAIFSKDYEQKAFYNDNIQEWRYIDIYVPITLGMKSIIIKPTIDENNIGENLSTFFKQTLFAGIFMIIAHISFMIIAYNILIRPLRYTNDVLEDQNHYLEHQKNQLQELNNQLNEELEMAQTLQKAILLHNVPEIDSINLGHAYIGMNMVSGDYIDIIQIDEKNIGLLIVDVSGHGVPSALITTMAKVSFNTHSLPGRDTAEICKEVNSDLYNAISESDYYLTAFYVIYNVETNEITFSNAGHCKPLIYRYLSHEIEEITTDGFFIGSFDFAKFEAKKKQLNPGDKLFLFTDGIIEAVNEEGELYDYKRLYKFIAQNIHVSATDFSEKIIDDVKVFIGSAPASDDISLIVLEIKREDDNENSELISI